jgi:hypothetical protein
MQRLAVQLFRSREHHSRKFQRLKSRHEKAMNSVRRMLIVMAILGLLFCWPLSAQEKPSATDMQTEGPSSAPGPTSAPGDQDRGWHFDLSPYLWFAGAHGTVGGLGRNASLHASPSDLLSHLDLGAMGAAELRYRRFLLGGDLLWIRLSQSRALPFPALAAISADVRLGQFVWTSKLGYRVVDRKKVKADAGLGARYWHLGQKLNFNPSRLGLNFNGSQSWGDIVIGGRVQLPVREKVQIDLSGDVGGWDATAKLDYEFAALLGYKLKPKWTLLGGYRYLFVDYRPGSSSVLNVVTSGALLGVTYHVK